LFVGSPRTNLAVSVSLLDAIVQNVEIVDTTCPWVSKVWNSVDKHQKAGLTSIIHGKYGHEETVATTSFCEDYICVKDFKEAEMVADYIVNGGDKEAFLAYFKNAVSEGFDPDTMLRKVGLANQTTMYKKETRAIGQLLQKAMMKKYGPADSKNHYMEFDTICDATQVRLVVVC
jgi:4-hydroxy-3-methylbut-2-en-1-yl diphosphate reductase